MPQTQDCSCDTGLTIHPKTSFWEKGGWILPLIAAGVSVYAVLNPVSRWLTVHVFGLDLASRLGSAVAFFLFDVPNVLLLLAGATFLVGFLQSYLDPDKTRDILSRRGGAWGHALASLFGIVTPFCSCSAVPLFIGFVRAGVPLGITFSYLVAAPMINEVALLLLLAMFGWKVAAFYAGTGLAVAFFSGLVLGRLNMERHLESWVAGKLDGVPAAQGNRLAVRDRVDLAFKSAGQTVGKVWPFVMIGIGVGAFIHGYIPEALLAKFMGKASWWTVPFAVLIGVPLYASTAMILPIVQTLLAKGAALGTVLAFMMAVTGLSFPETIILRKVMKTKLIIVFLSVVSIGILAVGYLFNLIL
jgi:hypothetical protein